jgi:hypothetical protein
VNKKCNQYGKLLCNACIVEIPQMGDRSRQELVEEARKVNVVPEKVIPCVFLIIFVISGGAGLYLSFPWWAGLVAGGILGAIVAVGLSSLKAYKLLPVFRTVTENVEVGRQKCCLACKQAVEHIR